MTEKFDDLDRLLPFYANGTLEGEEKRAVEARLEKDEQFRLELDYLKALRANIQREEITGNPGELGLARLHKAIEDEVAATAHPAPANDNSFWRITAIAAVVALIFSLGIQVFGPMVDDDGYSTASGSAVTQGPVFQIFFNEASPEKEIRAFLLSEKLSIVEGPSEIGYYRIAARDKLDTAGEKALLDRLNASSLVQEALQE